MEPVTLNLDDIIIDADAPEAQVKAASRDLAWRREFVGVHVDETEQEELTEEALEWLHDLTEGV